MVLINNLFHQRTLVILFRTGQDEKEHIFKIKRIFLRVANIKNMEIICI